jgi:hypothetical protein
MKMKNVNKKLGLYWTEDEKLALKPFYKLTFRDAAVSVLLDNGFELVSRSGSNVLAARKGNSWVRLPHPDYPWISPAFTGSFAKEYRESWMTIWGIQ